MSCSDRKDFDVRLAELNNWQIEQQKKLKAFQEAQKKLLDFEHHNVLNSLNIFKYGQRLSNDSEEFTKSDSKENEPKESSDLCNFNSNECNQLFQLKFPQIKLSEPKYSLFNMQNLSQTSNYCGDSNENLDENGINKPKKFLKRGEGLARFRMTLDDFKGPPKIYREKRIKTYLNTKCESKGIIKNTNSSKNKGNAINNKCNKKPDGKLSARSAPLSVKIYVPETKKKMCNSARGFEGKPATQNYKKSNDFYSKTPIENLSLKPHIIATEWYKTLKEKEKENFENKKVNDKNNFSTESDIESKKDEKELRIFEILEKKVDDTSFCSNSSFVDKLMEQSVSSTPSKAVATDKEMSMSYAQGLKSLRSQYLDEDQIKRCEELEEIPCEVLSDDIESEIEVVNKEKIESDLNDRECNNEKEVELEQKLSEETNEPESHKFNKSILQKYIKDFKKFKFLLAENIHRIEEEPEVEPSPKELLKLEEVPNQREIALKLQRKGLQDNVKQLLNWDCPPRKRPPKRVVKRVKPKPKLEKTKTVSKEQSEKIIFNSSLLYKRLNELEKEIQIFRKENRNLENLQRECNEERTKLAKERKEFEKQIQEEREKLEAKMIEEQKKLQKERAVFEKYCKQIKNQPTRQEREEIAKLKKEVEKLTETLTTKEGRWGAAQARLRNQIKSYEKEMSLLKAEVEKYKKQSMKKVSFENEKILNTKIIHAINAELGRLKPTVIKTENNTGGRNPTLSARIERNLGEKPIRRIKSAPNVKKQTEVDICVEGSNECDEKALGSVSTDSGIETNGSRYVQRVETTDFHDSQGPKHGGETEENSHRSSVELLEDIVGTSRKSESVLESVICESLFDDDMDTTSRQIAKVKSRLEKLGQLGKAEKKIEKQPVKMVRLPAAQRSSESEEESCSFDEQDEEEDCLRMISHSFRKSSPEGNYCKYSQKNLIESKLDENGIWEKLFEDGSKEINYPNGNVKKIFPGNKIVRMTYYNGDIKETNLTEGSEKYYYAETKTWHTTYKDGLEVLEFPNGQTERRHADGSTEISFPNGCVRYCSSSGKDEWRFLDGTVIKTNECGHKILLMPNGQKEIHTKEYKRREYPDGTVKILYSDGTQETRYSNGRVRLKDKDGNLVMDSGGIR